MEITEFNPCTVEGLIKNLSAPSWRAYSISSFADEVVRMIKGISLNAADILNLFNSSRPCTLGRLKSKTMMSGNAVHLSINSATNPPSLITSMVYGTLLSSKASFNRSTSSWSSSIKSMRKVFFKFLSLLMNGDRGSHLVLRMG